MWRPAVSGMEEARVRARSKKQAYPPIFGLPLKAAGSTWLQSCEVHLRKSTAIWDIAYLVGDGVITMDELEGFSEDLIDAVKLILGR